MDHKTKEANLAPVTIWSMSSESGYVPSSGYQHAIIVPVEKISAGAGDGSEALFNFASSMAVEQPRVVRGDIIDPEPYNVKHGACIYSGTSGLVEVPEGHALIVYHYESISTRNGSSVGAEVVGGKEDLADFYRRRAAHYSSMAARLDPQVRGGLGPDDEYR